MYLSTVTILIENVLTCSWGGIATVISELFVLHNLLATISMGRDIVAVCNQ